MPGIVVTDRKMNSQKLYWMGIAAKDQDHLLLKTVTDKCEMVASQRSCHCLLKQLNVDADKKANKHQQQYRKAHPFVLLSTHAGAFMTLAEGSITAKVITELHSFALRLHIQERNQWTDHIMSTINWVAHGKAFNGMIAPYTSRNWFSTSRVF